MRWLGILVLGLAGGLASAQAAHITQVVPESTEGRIEAVSVAFDTQVAPAGNPAHEAPVSIICNQRPLEGSGRWLDPSRWVFSLPQPLPAGQTCSVNARPDFLTLAGAPLQAPTQFTFSSGGPALVQSRPFDWSGPISEDQVFVLRFNAAIDPSSLVKAARCQIEGVGESVPVRLVTGQMRSDILRAEFSDQNTAQVDTPDLQLVQCKRRLPPDAAVRLVIGAGVGMAAAPQQQETSGASPVSQPAAQRPAGSLLSKQVVALDYVVRPPFKATLSCQRENARAHCTPLLPLTLGFSAPVPVQWASGIQLLGADGQAYPQQASTTDSSADILELRFPGPFPAGARLRLVVPDALVDDSGRPLNNARQFPLEVPLADYPPLVKFAAAPFGIIERFPLAPGAAGTDTEPALVPLTVRKVENTLATRELIVSAGTVSDHVVRSDQDILRWIVRLQRLEQGAFTAAQVKDILADRAIDYSGSGEEPLIDVRGVSALSHTPGVRSLTLPSATRTGTDTGTGNGQSEQPATSVDSRGVRPFEVIGLPVPEPGFHVLEVESPRLGLALLESAEPMFVRTSVLVTNLSVHMKLGRDDLMAWVTALDTGKPVAGAQVAALDCTGRQLAQGQTNDDGVWHIIKPLEITDFCPDTGLSGVMVSARVPATHPAAYGKADFSFVLSDWNRGIEPWRFNVPANSRRSPTLVTHTVLDRTLFRAGEQVSMKHYLRQQTRDGLAVPPEGKSRPTQVVITHEGSGESTRIPLQWQETPSGGLSAQSQFNLPPTARLGTWTVRLDDEDAINWYGPGSEFRVEAFRLPVLTGEVAVRAVSSPVSSVQAGALTSDAGTLVAPAQVQADVQLAYLSGGPASGQQVRLSGLAQDRIIQFKGYDAFSFEPVDAGSLPTTSGETLKIMGESGVSRADVAGSASGRRPFLDGAALTLDRQGIGQLTLTDLPAVSRPQQWVFEASFFDPNGQVQTLTQTVPVWPAAVQTGLQAEGWAQEGTPFRFAGLVLDVQGAPRSGVPLIIRAYEDKDDTIRRRLIGGFYAYDSVRSVRELGVVCQGETNAAGQVSCEYRFDQTGRIRLVIEAADDQGRVSATQTQVWVTGSDDLWFTAGNDDRIDIIAARKSWQPGEVAEFQVRMPFRRATALVAIEREGVLETLVVKLQASDPVIRIPVKPEWGPNAYLSVLAVRGRVYDVPWRSFLDWGYEDPGLWWAMHEEGRGGTPQPTTLVDLARPTYRFGLTPFQVDDQADVLDVNVATENTVYAPGQTVPVAVQVNLPDGTPAAGATIAFAAVDQALLELSGNTTWAVLQAMRQPHDYGVETATAQSQVVGRRHFGRKALPAGGGGGKSPTRELLDTLLAWYPDIQLDEQGRATIPLKLNDAITEFTLVAMADYGANRFGTGQNRLRSVRDLQIISGLPALVRDGDTWQAQVTVRNASARAMQVQVSAQPQSGAHSNDAGENVAALEPRLLELAAGQAQTLSWTVKIPAQPVAGSGSSGQGSGRLQWAIRVHELAVADQASRPAAEDALVVTQTVMPAVPVRVQQASLVSLDPAHASARLTLEPPSGALAGPAGAVQGGVQLQIQPALASGLASVRQWFESYPYTCFEQLGSRALGLESPAQWDALMQRLPDYLDRDGLLAYFPGERQGNEVLTAYVLSVTAQAAALNPSEQRFVIPEAYRRRMLAGLLAFVEGRIVRQRWAPEQDLDTRKLAVLDALSRHGLARPVHFDSLHLVLQRMPTVALIDWVSVLQRVAGVPQAAHHQQQALQVLRSRLVSSGTGAVFSGDALNQSWWLMAGAESNLARLMLLVRDDPQWRADVPLLARGLISLQQRGAWSTTTANLWGVLAIQAYSQRFESLAPSGAVAWSVSGRSGLMPVDDKASTLIPWSGRAPAVVQLQRQGQGTVWASVESLAAVPVTAPVQAGLAMERTVEAVSQAVPGVWSRGDIYRVRLKLVSRAPATWLVIDDPVPAGATILGSGLGRDSTLALVEPTGSGARDTGFSGHSGVPTYVERQFDAFRAYYAFAPAGELMLEYTVRLNTEGQFNMPASRAQVMYNPDIHAEWPNAPVRVGPAP